MRRLMWFTIGFAVACALMVWVLPEPWVLTVICIAAIGAVLIWLKKELRPVSVVFLGLMSGLCFFLLFQRVYLEPISFSDQYQQELVITASDFSYDTDYGTGVDGYTIIDSKEYRVRAYLDGDVSLEPGDIITGNFRLRRTTPAEESALTYHAGSGIFLLAYQKGELRIDTPTEKDLRHFPAMLAQRIEQTITDCFPNDTAAFAKALLLGETHELDYEQDTSLKLSGIRHVVAVSGLHVAIVFSLIQMATFHKPGLTALLGLPILLLFAALAGFTPSVCRAGIMCALMILGRLLNKEYDGATALSFSVLIMLAVNPLAITSVSLQLSVASVAGIFLFYNPLYDWLNAKIPDKKRKSLFHKLIRAATASVCVTLSAMVFTVPLSAYYFGTVSLIGPVTNLLTLWVVSFVFYGIAAVCALNVIWHGGAVFLAVILSYAIRYILLCADVLGGFFLACVYTQSVYIVFWLILSYCLFTVFCVQKRKSPGLLTLCVGFSLFICIVFSWTEPMLDDVHMTVLDVGQGQSILLQSEGRTFLIDCGGDSDSQTADLIVQTLHSQGIRRVDGVIVTHHDRDHAGALSKLLTRLDVSELIMPPEEDTEIPLDLAENCVIAQEDLLLSGENMTLKIYTSGNIDSENENSLCVLFERENCAILITGDRSRLGERLLMRKTQLPDVDVLIAGHHGAADSTSEELLSAVKPETVIISVGEDNIYGHPDPELLDRLSRFGCRIYRTDQNGTIVYRR